MFENLVDIEKKYEEIMRELGSPDIASDKNRYRSLMKEQSDLSPLVETYREYSALFDESLYEAIDLKTCMEKRISEGGTSVASVEKQIAFVRGKLNE